MKKRFLFPLLMLCAGTASSQVITDWVQSTSGVSIALDHEDNVFTVNYNYNPAGDITLTKRDKDGNFLWQASYNQTDNSKWEQASWVACDLEGNAVVVGTLKSGYSNPVNAASIIMKFDQGGNLLWRKVYESSFDGSYTKKCLIDEENNIYVLGMGSGPSGFVTKVKKFSPDGIALWSYFDAAGIGAPVNFKFTPDNHIVIIGRGIIGSINGYAKIGKELNVIWSHPGVNSLTVGDAMGDAFGNTYLINGEYVAGPAGSILTKLSVSGMQIWEVSNEMAGMRVEVGQDNNPVISGFPNSGTGGAAFMKYDSNGNMLWNNPDADGPAYILLLHAMLILDDAGNAYLAAGTLFEMAVCKVNSDGVSAWTATASGGYCSGMVLGSDNSIFVVGGTTAHFVEEISCAIPQNLFANNITASTAQLHWNAIPDIAQYEIWYKKTTKPNWKKRFVSGTKTKTNLKNLSCNTSYDWKIRSICDTTGIDLFSDFSPVQGFTTLSCKLSNLSGEPTISIFPNPVVESLSINIQYKGSCQINIIDLNGRTMFTSSYDITENHIEVLDVHSWAGGIYVVTITTGNQKFSERILVLK